MPLGLRGKKKGRAKETSPLVEGEPAGADGGHLPAPPATPPRLVFYAQLAHGSATGRVENFSSIRELYARIADVFEISPSEVRAGRSGSPPARPRLSHAALAETRPGGAPQGEGESPTGKGRGKPQTRGRAGSPGSEIRLLGSARSFFLPQTRVR